MERLVTYLEKRKRLSIALVFAYFTGILLLHDCFVKISVFIMYALTRTLYDRIVGSITLFFLAVFLFFFIKNLRTIRQAVDLKFTYLLAITGLIIIHTQMNFVMNIEIIHTLQFGLLALLIYPLTRSFGATLYYTVLLGAMDELYQYQVLYPEKNDYFDFNDLLLDQLGAALALLFMFSTGVSSKSKESSSGWHKSPVFISGMTIAIALAVMFRMSLITAYFTKGANPLMTLSESTGPESFWRHLANSDIVFHVITPLEGALSLVIICGLFFLLDFLAAKEIEVSENFSMKSSPVFQG